MKRFIVVGLGNFGSSVAETLHAMGHDVVALDSDGERVDHMATLVTRAAVGSGTDPRTLERIGAEDADAAIISTGDDITASAMTALMLRDLGVEEIYVKVISHDHARLIEKIGVTETIFPERESGIRLGKRISSRMLLNYMQLAPGFSLQETAVPGSWVGRSLRELQLPQRMGISVVAVHDFLVDELYPVPDPDAPLKESDTLLIAGRDENLKKAAGKG
ncbi:MAG: TrkA family potassium uptake protein [Longimicrobiales bacterium]|nr:TrkA family potassium uptake protein [Longimicrobiales bacterium]